MKTGEDNDFSYTLLLHLWNKAIVLYIFAFSPSSCTVTQYEKVGHVVFVCCITPSTSDHHLVCLSVATPGSLLITVDTVRKGEDRLLSGKECLLIISLGVSCQCQPCGEERQSLQREAGRRRQWVLGSQPVIASHCYSLHSPYTPDQSPKLCVPGLFSLTKKTWGFAACFCPF